MSPSYLPSLTLMNQNILLPVLGLILGLLSLRLLGLGLLALRPRGGTLR